MFRKSHKNGLDISRRLGMAQKISGEVFCLKDLHAPPPPRGQIRIWKVSSRPCKYFEIISFIVAFPGATIMLFMNHEYLTP